MKKYYLILVLGMLALSFNGYSQVKVDSYGRVMIGTTSTSSGLKVNSTSSNYDGTLFSGTSYANLVNIAGSSLHAYELYVGGEAFCTTGWSSSDEIFKKNIQKLDGTNLLTKLKKIEGKKYEFKSKAELGQILKKDINDSITTIPNFPEGEQYGLIAQEIEVEFPELVKLDSITMIRAINYNGMIPILLEALKAQQAQIENLQRQIEDCCNNNNNLKSSSLENNQTKTDLNGAKLYQNTPNPFNIQTIIRFEIPGTVQNAQLHISNMNGTLLKTFDINQRGSGNVTINGNELNAGMYMYTLVADGKEVDTKKMILTD